MGEPKQLLRLENRTLLRRAVDEALAVKVWPVVVVLGSHASQLRAELAPLPVQVAENPNWAEGMASSIQMGLKTLERFSTTLDGTIIGLCDQPYLSARHLNALLDAQRLTGKPLAACRYAEKLGPPALFSRRFFPELFALSDAEGARAVLARHAELVAPIDAPELVIDLDTPADYRDFLSRNRPT